MELEVGMYARTNDGYIARLKKINKTDRYIEYEFDNKIGFDYDGFFSSIVEYCNDDIEIIKASHNIIDLIEVGDYVNGYKVSFKGDDYQPFVQCDYPVEEGTTNHYRFYEEAIYSIVTKEQFESMSYKVGNQYVKDKR